jgi:hypothetical protein
MAINFDPTLWRDMHDRKLGVEVIKGTSITCPRIEEGHSFKEGVNLAVSMPKNDDLRNWVMLFKVNEGTFKSETVVGVM